MSTSNKFTENVNESLVFGHDFRYAHAAEEKAESVALMAARLKRIQAQSPETLLYARLLQFKIQMEHIIEQGLDNDMAFVHCLKKYGEILYPKMQQFAHDLALTPVQLSHYLHGRREPSEDFFNKLMLHSEQRLPAALGFDTKMWLEVFYAQKIKSTLIKHRAWKRLLLDKK
ncbi:MAG: hypothetical protein C0424_12110 [Sphingobacteriaceae bacterium]|nr:hypothetical protein [Sphingobacteriaceae bacterium]